MNMTITAGTKSTEHLARLVSAKLQVLKILVQLAERQLALVERGELTDLIKLLAAKQTVLAQLQTLERDLVPYRDDDPDAREWASPAARAACQAQATEANRAVARSLELEKRAESLMAARRDAAGEALHNLQTASDAHAAYIPTTVAHLASLQVEG
jgi:hypothetical protein